MRLALPSLVVVAGSLTLACASLLGVETVDYGSAADDAGSTDGDGSAPSDGRAPEAGADVALDAVPEHDPVVVCVDVEGGVCKGALPVCCLNYTANDKCVATSAEGDCPRIKDISGPAECDDFSDCVTPKVCCLQRDQKTILTALCLATCTGELMCDPSVDKCPGDASCVSFDDVRSSCR